MDAALGSSHARTAAAAPVMATRVVGTEATNEARNEKPRGTMRICLLASLTLLLGGPRLLAAQHFPDDAQVLSILQERISAGGGIGIVVGLLETDGTTRVLAAGTAGENARPLGERTVFEIGSITKVFTGTLLADMVSRGEVELDDPVGDFLPADVRVPSRGRRITLADLATHRSGLPRLPTNLRPADPANPYADYSTAQLYEFLSSYELTRDVGAEFEYSNLGVGLLGHALSLHAGVDYGTLLRQRVLAPLGMERTAITLTPEMRERLARGHDEGGDPVPYWDFATLPGFGALRSDVRDMLRFLDANVGAPTTELERAMRLAQQPRASVTPDSAGPSIGLAWLIRPVGDSRIVFHNGGTGGFRSFLGFDPNRNVGVVVLANSAHSVEDIGFHLLNSTLPLELPSSARRPVAVPPEILENYVGVYRLTPEFSIEVTREGDQLYVQATNQARFPIYAESSSEFFLRVVEVRITFEQGPAGEVTGPVLHQGGQSTPGRKVR